jgi:hypothetical protein
MAKKIGKWARIWIEGYELATRTSDVTFPRAHDEVEVSGYGQDKQYLAGQAESSVALDGYLDDAAGGTHAALKDLASGDASQIVSVALGANADPTTGDPTFHLDANQMKYESHPVRGGATAVHAEWKSRDFALEYGTLLYRGAATTDADGAAVDNGAGTVDGGAGYMHVTGLSAGDAITAKVQHSTNNSDWDDLVSFTLDGSALDGQRVAVSGTVNRYLRADWTVSGTSISFPIGISFVRN